MRALTFKGFLVSYVEELSLAGTSSINKLLKELDKNPRLKEPLIMHGIYSGLPGRVPDKYPDFYKEYRLIHDLLGDSSIEQIEKSALPYKYQKIVSAYEYKLNKMANDNETKRLMHNRIVLLQQKKHITNYQIYTDLKMNPGNINSFLKHGNVEKISLKSARKIWKYVKEEGIEVGISS